MVWVELREMRSLVIRYPLITAFVLSLVVHTLLFSGYRMGKSLGWWQHQATWLMQWQKKKKSQTMAAAEAAQREAELRRRQIPLTFVEVDPTTSVAEAPKEAKFYGAHNAKATNPDASMEKEIPKVDGQQTQVTRLEDVPKPKPFPLQPAIAEPQPEELQEARPKAAQPPGELTMAKASEMLRQADAHAEVGTGEAEKKQERPRTLAAARSQKNLAGERVKQDGGVRARGRVSLDVKATPFGAYDAAFIAAVQQRWYDLLEHTQFVQRAGKVVLEFRLSYDGRILDMKVSGNEVGEMLSLLCQRAVLDPQPYARWPSDMRRMIGSNFREVTFTFYYN